MNDIFNYIDPNSNDMFSVMDSKLLNKINNYCPDYRECLGLGKNTTFGTEIEFEDANINKIDELLGEYDKTGKWFTTIDNTLDDGGEVSSPVLKDNKKSWIDLKNICSIIKKYSIINNNCGGHIHVGTQVIGNDYEAWQNFFRIWSAYEHIIFKFSSDGRLIRPKSLIYAIPISKQLWNLKDKINEDSLSFIIDKLSYNKNLAISFQNVDIHNSNKYKKNNTIEFRCPNGTLDIISWQNYVNFFTKLLMYAKSNNFDKEIIEYRYNKNKSILNKINLNNYSSLEVYDKLYLRQALELCDYIFNNNLDKVNFIKQYTKNK